MARKDFIRRNEGFTCIKCGKINSPAAADERNHCSGCLFSLHVDEETPGDRKSACRSMMEPVGIDFRGAKGFMIKHRCIKCGKEILNSAAEDDDKKLLARIAYAA